MAKFRTVTFLLAMLLLNVIMQSLAIQIGPVTQITTIDTIQVGTTQAVNVIWGINNNNDVFFSTGATKQIASIEILDAQWGVYLSWTNITQKLIDYIKVKYPAYPYVTKISLSNEDATSTNPAIVQGVSRLAAMYGSSTSLLASLEKASWQLSWFGCNPLCGTNKTLTIKYLVNKTVGKYVEIAQANPMILEAPYASFLDWQQVPGTQIKMKHISVGPYAVWATGLDDAIYFREGVTPTNPTGTGWTKIDGALSQLDINQSTGELWGVNVNSAIWYRTGITPTNPKGSGWVNIPGTLSYIACGKGGVWGTDLNNKVYARAEITNANPTGSAWTVLPGAWGFCTAVGENIAWHLGTGNGIYYRTNVSTTNPLGTADGHLTDGNALNLSVSLNNMYRIDESGNVFRRNGVSSSTPIGDTWTSVGYGFKKIAVGIIQVPSIPTAQRFVNAIKTGMAATSYKAKITSVQSTLVNATYASLKYDPDLKGLAPTN
jgi:hypothetical protein